MAEDFNPNETTRLEVKAGSWLVNLASRRLTDILIVLMLAMLGYMIARQENMTAIVAANTTASQAGAAEMRVKLERMDANARMAACMLRDQNAADMHAVARRCLEDTGAGK